MLRKADHLKNNIEIIFVNGFINIQTELINFIINFISVLFYIVIFATILNKQVSNYLQFLLPGLIIVNILSAISYQGLKIWSLGSASKLMTYWLSLPYTIEFQLLSFSSMAVFTAFLYTLPIILIGMYLGFVINIELWVVIILLSSLLLFFLNLILVFFLFKTNSFIIVFNVSQPLLLRISPVFYPLIYLPLFALPVSLLNPITWMVQSLRGQFNVFISVIVLLFLDVLSYKFIVKYWKKKIKLGDLV